MPKRLKRACIMIHIIQMAKLFTARIALLVQAGCFSQTYQLIFTSGGSRGGCRGPKCGRWWGRK